MPTKTLPDSTDIWLLIHETSWPYDAAWWNARANAQRGLVESEAREFGLLDARPSSGSRRPTRATLRRNG